MACGEYGHFAVEKWQNLNFAHQYKEERRKVYASRLCAGAHFNTHKSSYFLYQMKAEIVYFVS